MKIYIRDIPEEGLTVNSTYHHGFVEQREDDHLKFLKPFKLKIKINRAQDDLLIKADVNGRFSSFCSRCLIPTEQEYKSNIDFFYEIGMRRVLYFSEENCQAANCLLSDVEEKGTEVIDITDDIRQEILLNLPIIILCSKDCKGICPSCGTNLNKEKCKCSG